MTRTRPIGGQALLQQSEQAQPGFITQAQVLDLPEVMQLYLSYAHVVGKEPIRMVRLTQQGFMRTQPGQKWMPAGRGTIRHDEASCVPLELHAATVSPRLDLGYGPVREGTWQHVIKLLSLITVGNARGPEMDQGELQRYLAEMICFPTAWLSAAIEWQAIDASSVRATFCDSGVTGSVVLHVNEHDQLTQVTADRYKEEHGHYLLAPWSARCNDYQEVEGMRIPTRIEITWHLASGEFTWFRAKITEIKCSRHIYQEHRKERETVMSQEPSRILILGAGVIGSVYATRLQAAGSNVTLLARGQHAIDLRASGLILEDASTGQSSTSHLRIIEQLVPEESYDLALVCVRLDQVAAIIPDLAANQHIPTLVFFLNNPTGTKLLVEQLGSQRVVLGFPGVGGTREGTRVRYVLVHQQPTTLGEVDGQITVRLQRLSALLEQAGFSTSISRSMDDWLKTHAVFVSCVSAALALEGGDSVRLGQNRVSVALMVNAIREGFAAVQSLGVRVTPFNLKLIFYWMPRWYAVRYWQRALQTDMGTLGMAPHANAAREEMSQVAREVLVFLKPSLVLVPTLKRLLGAFSETPPALQPPQE